MIQFRIELFSPVRIRSVLSLGWHTARAPERLGQHLLQRFLTHSNGAHETAIEINRRYQFSPNYLHAARSQFQRISVEVRFIGFLLRMNSINSLDTIKYTMLIVIEWYQ